MARRFWIGGDQPFNARMCITLPAGFEPVPSTSPWDVPAPLAAVPTPGGYRYVLVCCGPPAPYPVRAGESWASRD